jgi:LCP family protein required for cell wall assembly
MSRERDNRPREELPYRVYRAGSKAPQQRKRGAPSSGGDAGDGLAAQGAWRAPAGRPATAAGGRSVPGEGSERGGPRSTLGGSSKRGDARSELAERPYRTYRAKPTALRPRLRGGEDLAGGGRGGGGRRLRQPGAGSRRLTWKRGLAVLLGALVCWLALSLALFLISASENAGNLPKGAASQLTPGGPILTSANTVLIIGLDSRPRSGPGSKEPGANHNELAANTDTIMLWRIGGGVSRRLSIPRDTLVDIPGLGEAKINAAWGYGGPALALKVIERFTGLKINHLIVVDLANFPKFINDVGGVTVRNDNRICATIAGGPRDGGFALNLNPGVHHLNGLQAELYARVRENPCDLAYNDIVRERHQQQILNGIKAQLLTLHTFLHLPWVAWDAPRVLQTDMGGPALLQMFLAAEMAGSPPPKVLNETPSTYNGADVLLPNQANVRTDVRALLNGG